MSWDGVVSDELVPGLRYPDFVAEALRHASETSFRASSFFQRQGLALENLFTRPWIRRSPATARLSRGGLGVVHWNIEKGVALPGIKRFLAEEPRLGEADLLCLNEVDCGTARGLNADEAWELADALGCHAVYLPSFIECTKGWGEDLLCPGENRLGFHGLAILSRLPVLDVRVALLPPCFDYFAFEEKRFGYRQGLYLKLDWDGRGLVAATTHLEVRNTPRCRARQFAGFLEGLRGAREAWGTDLPALITGDWNTNSFRRGGLYNSAVEFRRIVRTPPEDLAEELIRPFARDLGGTEDLAALPRPLADAVARVFHLRGRVLRMRLDWIAARGLRPRSAPWTLDGMTHQGRRLSDHAVIGVELES